MSATTDPPDLDVAEDDEQDGRRCDASPDPDGLHCNHWFWPTNGGQQGEADCCYCDLGHDCHALDGDDEPDYREWDYADASGGGW